MKPNLRYYTSIVLLSAATTAPAYARSLQPAAAQQTPVFVENKGQITDQYGQPRTDIDFKLETPGMSIYIGKGQIHYQWQHSKKQQSANEQPGIMQEAAQPSETELYRMDVSLVGAATHAKPVAEEQQAYYEQYYLPQQPDGIAAHSYTRITYRNVYPNIDWVVYSKNNEVKYDFVVHPGGDSHQIKLRYEGASSLKLQDGALKASTPFGSITERAPYSYTINSKEKVASAYLLNGHTLSFKAPKDGIVIDPVLEWATYYGGTLRENERALCSTLDDAGNAYLAGATTSTNNIVTVGAYLTTYTGEGGYIVKFNTAGVRQWATYYPGAINAMCTDATGTVYITGYTTTTSGIATPGAHQTTYAGIGSLARYGDAFLAKFTASGTRVWGTYFGGAGSEMANGIACDPAGNVYISGFTSSNSGIATMGAHATTLSGTGDGYIAKFNANGLRQWSTYHGGTGRTIALHCDAAGDVYVGGHTKNTTGIATTGTHQATFAGPGNIGNGYLIKFNSSGVRQWGTYYGNGLGAEGTYVTAICSDQQNNVYIGGVTLSNSGIASTGSYMTAISFNLLGFAAKFNGSGVRQWGTYYGGNISSIVNGIACKQDGSKVYLYGQTVSTSGIATVGAFQSAFGGNWDTFIGVLNGAGTTQLWGTYYGGTDYDFSTDDNNIASIEYTSAKLSFNGSKLLAAGTTRSTTGIAYSGHQSTLGGEWDSFLLSLAEDTSVYIIQPYIDTLFCPGDTFHLAYGVSPGFAAGNVFTVQMSDANGSFATPVTIGTRTATTAGNIIVTIPHNTPAGSGYRLRIVATAPAYTSNNNGVNIRIKAAPTVPVATSNTPVCAGQNLALDVSTPGPGIAYSWAGPGSYIATVKNPTINAATTTASGDYIVTVTLTATGCALKDTITATVGALPPAPVAGNSGPVCAGQPLQLTATGVAGTYNWTGPATIPPGQNPVISNTTTGNSGSYSVTVTANGCTSLPGNTMVSIKPVPATPAITGNSPVCLGTALNLQAVSTPGSSYQWTGPNGYTSNAQNINIFPATNAHAGGYGVVATLNGCNSLPALYLVQVNTVASTGAYASPNDTICPGATVQFVAFAQNAGTAPAFQWYRNGVPETTAPVFTTNNIAHGDRFWCSMTATGVCATPLTVVTDTIRMAVVPMTVTPSVMITALPGVHIRPGTLITFTAYMQNGGFAPKYQWKKNGVNVGVTTATWATDKLLPGDAITVELESNDHCASPKTATSAAMYIGFPLGIKDNDAGSELQIYPNPNSGSFTISGITTATVQAEVINSLGQTVYTRQHEVTGGNITLQTILPAGAYLIRLYSASGTQLLRFSITK